MDGRKEKLLFFGDLGINQLACLLLIRFIKHEELDAVYALDVYLCLTCHNTLTFYYFLANFSSVGPFHDGNE
jgi:hypothetical protein